MQTHKTHHQFFTNDNSILANIIATKWSFNLKSDCRYKSSLVSRGDRQSESTYNEVYSPTLRPKIAQSIFSLAVNHKWFLNQYDFTTAYINSNLLSPFIFLHLVAMIHLNLRG